jgi:hypothetical protein
MILEVWENINMSSSINIERSLNQNINFIIGCVKAQHIKKKLICFLNLSYRNFCTHSKIIFAIIKSQSFWKTTDFDQDTSSLIGDFGMSQIKYKWFNLWSNFLCDDIYLCQIG